MRSFIARGQVAAFNLPRDFDPAELCRALNSMLPADIVIAAAALAEDSFDPRRDAKSRVYEYHVLNRERPSPFAYRYSWLVHEPLDLWRMNEAARLFIGAHDLAAFRTLGTEMRTTVRRVDSSEWRRDVDELIYRVEASSFLRHQVRTMVMAMVEIGRGKFAPSLVGELISNLAKSRNSSGRGAGRRTFFDRGSLLTGEYGSARLDGLD